MTSSGELDEKALVQIAAMTTEWTSAAPDIVSVEGGTITAQANGETTITLAVTHGETTQTASISIVVATRVSGIALPDTLTVKRGDTADLTATVEPATATNTGVMYESADPEIASVDASGTVKGLALGQVEITAHSAENPAIYASCAVTVEAIPESIELSQTEAVLYTGRTFTLEATVGPEDVSVEYTILFESDNEGVATGTATITARLAEYDEILASCTVTVQRATTHPRAAVEPVALVEPAAVATPVVAVTQWEVEFGFINRAIQ